jgi:ADP-ribose pyrophosphatase YjhB (NUDIX family)
MDLGETAEQAGIRETMEEARLEVRNPQLLGVYTRVGPGVVVIVYVAEALGDAEAGDETTEVAWFAPGEIPWDELSFDTTHAALRAWLATLPDLQ